MSPVQIVSKIATVLIALGIFLAVIYILLDAMAESQGRMSEKYKEQHQLIATYATNNYQGESSQ